MKSYLWISAILLLISAVSAKVTTRNLPILALNKTEWEYISKFAVGPGPEGGQFKVKMQFQKVLVRSNMQVQASFLVYKEDQWNKAKDIKDCHEKQDLAQFSSPITIPLNGTWSNPIEGNLGKQSQSHVWFFVVSDCKKNLKPHIVGKKLRAELEILNSNGSHFGEDEGGIMLPLLIVTVIIAGFFVLNSIRFFKFYRSEESMDYPTLIVASALLIELLGVICEIGHLNSFAVNGEGNFALDFGNKALSIISQAIISCLLLLMASGWSIDTLQLQNKETTVPLMILLFVSHLLIVGLGVATEEEHYRFHDYESLAGLAIIAIRLLLFIIFGFLIFKTYRSSSDDKQKFFTSFGLLSTLYFLAFPCLIAGSSLFLPAHMRHKIVSGGTLILQTLTLIFFTSLFSSKTTQYYKVSFKGRSLLPENKLH